MTRPGRPLATRLRCARILVADWRRAVLESERDRTPGAENGGVSPTLAAELARFDEARQALTEAIAAAVRSTKQGPR